MQSEYESYFKNKIQNLDWSIALLGVTLLAVVISMAMVPRYEVASGVIAKMYTKSVLPWIKDEADFTDLPGSQPSTTQKYVYLMFSGQNIITTLRLSEDMKVVYEGYLAYSEVKVPRGFAVYINALWATNRTRYRYAEYLLIVRYSYFGLVSEVVYFEIISYPQIVELKEE